MAMFKNGNSVGGIRKVAKKRALLRKILLEGLERRELMAVDSAAPVFAPGTPQEYVNEWINRLGTGSGQQSGEGNSGNFEVGNRRWSNPTGGGSTNQGDTATVSWSIVPDGTLVNDLNGTARPSNLIAFLDGIYGSSSGPVQNRPWFPLVKKAYDSWAAQSGLTFIYEPVDDGAPQNDTNRGVVGVRGDVRIGGTRIDGDYGILAFNYYPNGGGNSGFDGDMVIDTEDTFFRDNADGATGENRGIFNVLMHEAGHGIGIAHVEPVNETKLMEPFVSFKFLGAQHDDILGAQRLYGDDKENNDGAANATDFGTIKNGTRLLSNLSMDNDADRDFFGFDAPSSGKISITVTPVGFQYNVGPQGGTPAPVDTLRNSDLSFQLLGSDGQTVLAQVNAGGLGVTETLTEFEIRTAGRYYIRVDGSTNAIQLYDMSVVASGFRSSTDTDVRAPQLISVNPNAGSIFSFTGANVLNVAPRELTFRFDGAQRLDPKTLKAIRITRSGDGTFGNGNDFVVDPGYLGFGDTERIVIARFKENLPDDKYRIEIFGYDDPDRGIIGLRNVDGILLQPRVPGTDRDVIDFRLELGAQIVSVVPQPVVKSGSVWTQQRDKIEVYFNEDMSGSATVTNPIFYQLFLTQSTIRNTDDLQFNPTSVTYDAATRKATLTFSGNLDQLAGAASKGGAYRLRIGTNEAVPSVPVILTPVVEPGDSFVQATDLGSFGSMKSLSIEQEIRNVSTYNLDFPGAPDTPGDREINANGTDVDHLPVDHLKDDVPDTINGVTVQYYNFLKDQPYGTNTQGQLLYSSITPTQEQRIREVFSFYAQYLGIKFVETNDPMGGASWTIAVGDLIPLGSTSSEGGTLGLAGSKMPMTPNHTYGRPTVILDRAETWNDSFGASDNAKPSFFVVAMREIGNLLGLGASSDLPPGTNNGAIYNNQTLGGESKLLGNNPVEPVFPGDNDIVHGRYLHRPDSRDIDLYKFSIPAGQAGLFTAEVVAERKTDSSLLDSYLTLYREKADGSREVIAVNDDYFSQDSLLQLDLQAGTYFLGVSASGNSRYNPDIQDSGLGGTSEGNYSLKTTFRPLVNSSIVDAAGSALDGDMDGAAGGVFNFWFRTAEPLSQTTASTDPRTLFVDKAHVVINGDPTRPIGSLANPFNNIQTAFSAAKPNDIVRILGNGGLDNNFSTLNDSYAYEIGRGGPNNQPLSDGQTMNVPKGVTVMIDAGALFKLRGASINAGSTTSSVDRSRGNLQVLGVPGKNVIFTSYQDQTIGVRTNPIPTTPVAGDWGGIEFKGDVDLAEGRFGYDREGIFLDYVNNADFRFGGGQVSLDSQSRVITPIQMTKARPTVTFNKISFSADAAMSADPDSFEESTFTTPMYQLNGDFTPDYARVGPQIRGNALSSNTTNGLFVRIDTLPGNNLTQQTVAGRWDDSDITYVVGQNLMLAGTAGGPKLEDRRPTVNLVALAATTVTGGALPAGSYNYRFVMVDAAGGESLSSLATQSVAVNGTRNAVQISNLPAATTGFVARRVYRSQAGGAGPYDLVAEISRSSTVFVDRGGKLNSQLIDAAQQQRPRQDASLVIDPGIIVKSDGARIEAGIGSTLIAEGKDGIPVIFTSRRDDRYGASGSFDTNNDGKSSPNAGDWGGIIFGHLSKGSIDHALVTYAGGITNVAGNFAGFNATEIHQADVRITNTVYEQNASGFGGQASANRDGRGFNEAAVIFVRGAQPVLIGNIFRNNPTPNTPVISINANALTTDSVLDNGRQRGLADRLTEVVDNMGPLVYGNFIGNNTLNGMDVRGQTLTTATVWDDTNIVHILRDEIIVPDLHVFGGLQIKSRPTESMVVKLSNNAGFTATGRPLEIDDRIGGIIQVLGSPGFPVYLTSIADDSIGAGFDPNGQALNDTNGDGPSLGSPGAWRSIRLDKFSHDRNVESSIEQESPRVTAPGNNALPANAQSLGILAPSDQAGDDNSRLGFTVQGVINEKSDIDVYSFTADAGTEVWFDIDRTTNALDTVVELINGNGEIIAQSDNSYDEAIGSYEVYKNPELITLNHVNSLPRDSFFPKNGNGTYTDFYSTNPFDAGFRIVLPGAKGEPNKYFVRVRSSNIDSLDPVANRADLQDPSKIRDGKTTGRYQLQVRLRELDEWGGSTVRYADIRYATTGIEVLGMPIHSPLLGEAIEPLVAGSDPLQIPITAINLGNLANSDRAALSVASNISAKDDVDWYRFDINIDSIQGSGLAQHLATIIDVDYADGLSRPNTSFWLYYDAQGTGNGSGQPQLLRLMAAGTDSNVADDRPGTLNGSNMSDMSRGSVGFLDAYLGSTELKAGTYFLAVTNNSLVASDFQQWQVANPSNPLARVEPVNSIYKLTEDRFNMASATTAFGPLGVAFTGGQNRIDYHLGDVVLFVSRPNAGGTTSDLLTVDPLTGAAESTVTTFPFVYDIAMRPDGNLYGYEIPRTVASTDANNGNYVRIDTAGNGTSTVRGRTGIQTFERDTNTPPGAKVAANPETGGDDGVGMQFRAITYTNGGGLGLYGVASRGYNLSQWSPINANAEDARNYIYQMNPVTGAATSSPQSDRTDNPRANTGTTFPQAGTQIRERGNIDTTDEINPQPSRVLYTSPARTNLAVGNITDGDKVVVNSQVFEFDNGNLDPQVILSINQPNLYPQDGQTFTLRVGALTYTYEFDTGPVLQITAGGSTTLEGQTITITETGGAVRTFEFSADAALSTAGAVRIPYRATDSAPTLTAAIANAVNNSGFALQAVNVPGTLRISLVGDIALTENADATIIAAGTAYGTTTPGATRIVVEEFFTNAQAAAAIQSVINGSPPSGVNATVTGNTVTFVGADIGFFDNVPWFLVSSTGSSVAPGNIPIPFNITDSADEIAATVYSSLSTVIPGVTWTGNSVSLPNGYAYNAQQTHFQRSTFGLVGPLALDYAPPTQRLQNGAPTAQPYVQGITISNSRMYAVTEVGDLFEVGVYSALTGTMTAFNPSSTQNTGDYIATILDPTTGAPVQFSGLTTGPRNVEGGKYANLLFGIASNGDIYAFDTRGRLQPVFANGASRISTGVGGANGLAFSNLDVNLWHVSANRSSDAGHGVNQINDGSRTTNDPGGRSLYFGFEDPKKGANIQTGNWGGVWDLGNTGVASDYDAARYNTYEFPGGAHGAIESNPLDLSNYSKEDKPTLYFNYRLATENANSDLNDGQLMRDSFRVYAATDDGFWQILATNNSSFDNERVNNSNDEKDYAWTGTDTQVQELYDVNDTNNGSRPAAPNTWRQARIDLGDFAGKANVRLKFEFATAGSVGNRDTGTGGEELRVVPGHKLADGDIFTIEGVDFEFEFGATFNAPTGANITEGSSFDVNGTIYTFTATPVSGTDILFDVTDNAGTIASRVAAVLQNNGLSVSVDPVNLTRIAVSDATFVSQDGSLPANFIDGQPGVNATSNPVYVSYDMSDIQVRDAIRVALALEFNALSEKSNIDTFRVQNQILRLHDLAVDDPGPLGLSVAPVDFGGFGSVNSNTQGQNNRFEGVYVDDIIVGFAERGELVTGAADNATTMRPNAEYEVQAITGDKKVEVETGSYQLEIRRAASFGTSTGNSLIIDPMADPTVRTFDTNDRLVQGFRLVSRPGSQIGDGESFTLSDGVNTVVFEFNDITISPSLPNFGITQGNIEVPFRPTMTSSEVAEAIRDAINSSGSQAILKVTAELLDSRNAGTPSGAIYINLYGAAGADNGGSTNFGDIAFEVSGVDTFAREDAGDKNRYRDQGQILLHGNIIRDSSSYGIVVDAGSRTSSLTPLAGALPHSGPIRNLPQINVEGLVPGVVAANNVLAQNRSGGILFSGDTRGNNVMTGAVPFGRIVNNTIYGIKSSDTGITVTDNASPTLLNNIVANAGTGILVDSTSSTTVVGYTLFKDNNLNVSGTTTGALPILLNPADPLFVNASGYNFYPAPLSQAIDSSLDSLSDRPELASVRGSVGIPVSPILSPDLDITGQLRVDDPAVTYPSGQGDKVFKDRGAYDRADFVNPIAELLVAQDNDNEKRDIDPNQTYVQLLEGTLDHFSILLREDNGTGPDVSTVTNLAVTVIEDGRLLVEGVDYTFGFNVTNRTIRLTPLSGIWKPGSAYEITLNNRDRFVLKATDGASVVDGQQFRIIDKNGVAAVYEYESGFSIQVPKTLAITVPAVGAATGGVLDGQTFKIGYRNQSVTFELDTNNNTVAGNTPVKIAVGDTAKQVRDKMLAVLQSNTTLNLAPKAVGNAEIHLGSLAQHTLDISNSTLIPSGVSAGIEDGQRFTFTQDGAVKTFEFNVTGDTAVGTGNIAISFDRTMTNADLAQLIVNAMSAQGFDLPVLADLGSGLVHLGGRAGQTLVTTNSLLRQQGAPGVTKSLELLVPTMSGPGAIQDGETFKITRGAITVTFEFNSNTASTPGNTVINFSPVDTADQVAQAIANVIAGSPLGITPTALPGGVVRLNEGIGYVIDTGTSRLIQSGVSGGAIPIVYTPSAAFTDVDMAGVIINAINGTAFGADSRSRGGATIFVANASTVTDIDAFEVLGITDIAGNPLAPNRSNQETQFTILLPGVNLDYGDAPDPAFSTVLNTNGARHVVLANNPLRLGTTITTETEGQPGPVATDDVGDDGVFFTGIFNENSNPVTVSITASSSGLIDAWFDWNRDGDWNDPGEQVMAMTPVRPGLNNFSLMTPKGASAGQTFARFRLSSAGGLAPTGVGMDGEVEDYMIDIIPGTPPVGTNDQYVVIEDQTLITTDTNGSVAGLNNNGVFVNDVDVMSGTLSALLVNGPTNGNLTFNPSSGLFTYKPNANYFGADSFVYQLQSTSGLVANQPTTVNITVVPVNDIPSAVNKNLTSGEGAPVVIDSSFLLAGSSAGPANETAAPPAGQGQTVKVVSVGSATPAGSTVSLDPVTGKVTFTPASKTTTQGTFVYTIRDNGKSGTVSDNTMTGEVDDFREISAVVTIDFIPVNDAPIFTPGANPISVNEDSGLYDQVWATNILPGPADDPSEAGQVVTFECTADQPGLFETLPAINATTGKLSFKPAANKFGTTVVTIIARDNGSSVAPNVNASDPYYLTIAIQSVNDVPVASNYNYTVSENDLLSISAPGLLANATDADLPNDTLTSVGIGTTSARGGTVVVNANGSFTYDPRSVAALQAMIDGQSLNDSFTYFVRDAANAQSLPATVTIKVNGVNDPPVANNNSFIVPSGTTQVLRILDNDTDVDTAINPGSVTLEQLPSFGTAIVNADGTVSYRPALNYRGTDTFTYRVRDVLGAVSNIATVNILVNDPPVANNDQTYTVRNTPVDIDVLLNDRDPDGTLDPTSVTITSGPSTGTAVALANGKIRFTPANDFVGTATLSYTVKDNVGTTSNVAQVQIQVISSSYQNPSNRLDVNADGFITAIDALIIINDLNRNGPRQLVPGAFIPPPFLDTDGNNFVNSIDILQVINFLNGEGEGEGGLSAEGEGSDYEVEYLGGGLVTRATVTPVSGQSMLETVGPAMVRDIRSNMDTTLFGTKRNSGASFFGGIVDGIEEDGDIEDLYALLAAGDEDEDQASDQLMANIDDFLL